MSLSLGGLSEGGGLRGVSTGLSGDIVLLSESLLDLFVVVVVVVVVVVDTNTNEEYNNH